MIPLHVLYIILPLACMQCVKEQFGPTWLLFAGIRLLAVGMLAGPRLDRVRVLGLGVLLELVFLFAFAESAAMSEGVAILGKYAVVAVVIFWMFLFGLVHFFMLWGLSRTRYFHGGRPRVSCLRLLLLVPVLIGIHLIQFVLFRL